MCMYCAQCFLRVQELAKRNRIEQEEREAKIFIVNPKDVSQKPQYTIPEPFNLHHQVPLLACLRKQIVGLSLWYTSSVIVPGLEVLVTYASTVPVDGITECFVPCH